MKALDTNVLVYAHRRDADVHAAAAELLRRLAEGRDPWAIPWPCLYEFFAVVTHARIYGAGASTPAQAWAQIDGWLAAPTVRLLAEPEDFARTVSDVVRRSGIRGPRIHDARIAALCIAHGVEALITRDRDFTAFPQLRTEHPFPSR